MPNETAREIFVSNLRRLMADRRNSQMDIATPITGKSEPRIIFVHGLLGIVIQR